MPRRKAAPKSRASKKRAPRTRKEAPEEPKPLPTLPSTSGPRWLPWQDRYLAQEVYKHRPFAAGRGKEGEAWDQLAEELKKDSEKQGQKSVIIRTGEACKARMKRLLDAHRREETISLQKTRTNEEVDEHIKIMTEVAQLYEDQLEESVDAQSKMKMRKELEEKGSKELRDASMLSLVRREELSDISQAENLQQNHAHNHHRTVSELSSGDEKENGAGPSVLKKRRATTSTVIKNVLNQRIKQDEMQLADAQIHEEERHKEIVVGQQQIIDSLNAVARGLELLVKDRSEERREAQKHQLEMIAMFRGSST